MNRRMQMDFNMRRAGTRMIDTMGINPIISTAISRRAKVSMKAQMHKIVEGEKVFSQPHHAHNPDIPHAPETGAEYVPETELERIVRRFNPIAETADAKEQMLERAEFIRDAYADAESEIIREIARETLMDAEVDRIFDDAADRAFSRIPDDLEPPSSLESEDIIPDQFAFDGSPQKPSEVGSAKSIPFSSHSTDESYSYVDKKTEQQYNLDRRERKAVAKREEKAKKIGRGLEDEKRKQALEAAQKTPTSSESGTITPPKLATPEKPKRKSPEKPISQIKAGNPVESYNKFKVPQLRKKLTELGLSKKGNKSVLIIRLSEHKESPAKEIMPSEFRERLKEPSQFRKLAKALGIPTDTQRGGSFDAAKLLMYQRVASGNSWATAEKFLSK